MNNFKILEGLSFNKGLIQNPDDYFRKSACNSWLYLVGPEFAQMEGGMSYEQVQQSTPHSINIISDPPRELNLELAKKHVAALDSLPRPTLVTCRTGPRASAVAYMYSGLKLGAEPEEVLSVAEREEAPFVKFDEYREWVRSSIEKLRAMPGEVKED